jgi:hypothetical protein
MKRNALIMLVLLALAAGCAGVPVREAVKVDTSLPLGKIEGNQFVGIRYPFKVSAPPNWQVTTKFPDFMVALGYDKEGLETSQVFVFNPSSQSNLQIDFETADRYTTFSQEMMEGLVGAGVGSFKEEIEKDYGKEVQAEIGPTERVYLKGVPYAARKYAIYTHKSVKWEQGWVYAFSEPYQIFILYMINETKGANDRGDLKTILDSFEYIQKK